MIFRNIVIYILGILVFVVFDPSNRVLWITIYSVAGVSTISLARWFPKLDHLVRIGISFVLGVTSYLMVKMILR